SLPHPDGIAALREMSLDRLGFLQRCNQEYEGIVPLQLGDELVCVLNDPGYITEVLKRPRVFIKDKETQALEGLVGKGLVTSEGDFWARQRRLAQPIFRQKNIDAYANVMVEYTQRMLESWQDGAIRDVSTDMMRLALDIVMKTLLGQEVQDVAAQRINNVLEIFQDWLDHNSAVAVAATLAEIGEQQAQISVASSESIDKEYQDAIALFDETVYDIINYRRANGLTGNDLLGLLMQVEDADDGTRMTDQQLRDESATFIMAGHETTANLLSWTWMLLAQNPQVRERLNTELKTVLNGRPPTVADLPQLTYADWVLKESLRLYPPAHEFARGAAEDYELDGYIIPKGTTVLGSQWAMHRNPHYFNEPETFQPEPWDNDLEKQLPRGVYFPFNDGPRVCIGKSFSIMEALLLLATISQQFQLDLVPNQIIEPRTSIALKPKHGLQVVLKANS
ncbi:MAG: cytochrome P450, partial [Cyanobacteria bacterium J06633_8]